MCFSGLIAKDDKDRIDRIIRKAERIVGEEQLRLDSRSEGLKRQLASQTEP